MKLTTTFYLLAVGTLLIFSCKKENDRNSLCENCIIISPDTLQNRDTTPAIPVAVVTGSQATINLTSSGSFLDSDFTISIGNSGDLLYEQIDINGQNFSWSFSNLSPGTYPVRIKQTNYVTGSPYPEFNFTITWPNGTIGPVVPVTNFYNSANEVDYSIILQVNP